MSGILSELLVCLCNQSTNSRRQNGDTAVTETLSQVAMATGLVAKGGGKRPNLFMLWVSDRLILFTRELWTNLYMPANQEITLLGEI